MWNQTPAVDIAILRMIAKDRKTVVEVGTFTGGTAEVLADAMPDDGHLVTIDSYKASPVVDGIRFVCGEAILMATNRLNRFGDKVSQVIGDSLQVANLFPDESIDMVFIDGAHDYESVVADILSWGPKVKPDGLVSGHDWNRAVQYIRADYAMEKSTEEVCDKTKIHFGVARALGDLLESFQQGDDTRCSIWWAEPKKIRGVENV